MTLFESQAFWIPIILGLEALPPWWEGKAPWNEKTHSGGPVAFLAEVAEDNACGPSFGSLVDLKAVEKATRKKFPQHS